VAAGILDLMKRDHLPETGRLANIVTTTELLSAGFSTAQIRTKINRGELVRLHYGIYGPAELVKSVAATRREALALRAAATLAPLGPRAVASHHTAAQLFGLDLLGRVPASVAARVLPGFANVTSARRASISR
jgi:hypothetical protein